ncbi:hypothetical protein ACO0QE_001621 [Hanseniaspora vineae]
MESLKKESAEKLAKTLATPQSQFDYIQNLKLDDTNQIVPTYQELCHIHEHEPQTFEHLLKYLFKRLFGALDDMELLALCCMFDSIVDEVIYLEAIQDYLVAQKYDYVATILTLKVFENEQLCRNLSENLLKKGVSVPFYYKDSLKEELQHKQSLDLFRNTDVKIMMTKEDLKALPTFNASIASSSTTGQDSSKEDTAESSLTDKAKPDGSEYVVLDMTNKEQQEFQKKIYLVIKGSLSGEEAAHKLIKLKLTKPGEKLQTVDVLVKSCSHEQTYSKYYGIMAELLCQFHKSWCTSFAEYFEKLYTKDCESYEPNQLRNVGKFYGHLFASDYLGFESFELIHMNQEESTASTRIFVKFIFSELVMDIGIKELKERLNEPYIQPFLRNMFPMETVDDNGLPDSEALDRMRFSINFFTAIKLGALTDKMRQQLKSLESSSKNPSRPSRFSNSRKRRSRRRSISPARKV